MDTLLALLKGAAPMLATVVAGPLGGKAVSMIAEKFGVEDTVEAVAKAIAGDPEATQKLAEIDLAQFRAEAEDRDSARDREVGMAAAGATPLAQLVVPILALGTVATTFLFIAALLFLEIKTEQQQLIIFALGYATAAAQQVLSYYFGSSKSSQDKTAALSKAVK
jgi:cellobiose phosphorylase